MSEKVNRIIKGKIANREFDKHILIAKLDEIGDMILLSPFLRELRKNEPHAYITLITKPKTAPLVVTCPYIDNLIIFEPKQATSIRQSQQHAIKFARQHLQKMNIDLAIIPRYGIDEYFSRWILAFSGAKVRICYEPMAIEKQWTDNLGSEGLRWIQRDKLKKHEVERNLSILSYLGYRITDDSLEIWCDQTDFDRAACLLNNMTDLTVPNIAVSPGARLRTKQWPWQRFLQLSKRIIDVFEARILLIGSKEESRLCKKIESQLDGKATNFAGMSNLRETAAIVKRCRCFIGNDSASMHIAAAMGIPCIGLFRGDTTRWKPWKNQSICLQGAKGDLPWNGPHLDGKPFYMGAISVDEVLSATLRLLK